MTGYVVYLNRSCDETTCDIYYEAFITKRMLASGYYVVEVDTFVDDQHQTRQKFVLKRAGRNLVKGE